MRQSHVLLVRGAEAGAAAALSGGRGGGAGVGGHGEVDGAEVYVPLRVQKERRV